MKPHRPLSHRGLGAALFAQGFFAEAEVAYREALRLRPDDAQSHFDLWTVLEKQDKHAESEAAYREAIRVKPDHAEAHSRLGTALGHQGRWEEAEAACREAVRLSPDDARFRNRAGGRPSAAAIAPGMRSCLARGRRARAVGLRWRARGRGIGGRRGAAAR